jgi:hypothetical protein
MNLTSQYLRISLILVLIILIGVFTKKYLDPNTNWHQSEINAVSSLIQIYEAEWKWNNLDTDKNSNHDFWARDIAGLYFYINPLTGKIVKYIPKEIAVADLSPHFNFYLGNQFECIPEKGYNFKMAQYDVSGFYLAKKDPSTNLEYVNDEFCAIAFPVNPNLNTFIINSSKKVLYKKVEHLSKANKCLLTQKKKVGKN